MNSSRSVQRTLTKSMLMDEQLFLVEKGRSLPLRVVYLSLHLMADRNGNFDWSSQLARFLLPDDEKKVRLSLEALTGLSKIVQYRDSKGIVYGHIRDFRETQHINNREMASARPLPSDEDCLMLNHNGEWVPFDGPVAEAPIATQPIQKRGRGRPRKNPVATSEIQPRPQAAGQVGDLIVPPKGTQTGLQLAASSNVVMAGGPRFIKFGTGKNTSLYVRFDDGERDGILVDQENDLSPKAIGMLKPCKVVGHEFKVYLSQAILDHFNDMYQVNNVLRVNRATSWIEENPTKTKTLAGLKRFYGGWIARAHNNNQDIVQLNGVSSGASNYVPPMAAGRADMEVSNIAAQGSQQIRSSFSGINGRRQERRS